MSETKEKSPVGMGVPARDTEINRKTSISHFGGKIKCVLQKPGEISEVVSVDNDISSITDTIGGTPATMVTDNGLLLVYNRYGYDSDGNLLEINIMIDGIAIRGTVLITAIDSQKYSLTTPQIQSAREWLLKHCEVIK